jgi:hypothetical protein
LLTEPFPLVERLPLTDAKAFLDSLSPLGPVFGRFANVESWAFRGHADSKWQLLPTALRPHVLDDLFKFARLSADYRNAADRHAVQCLAEARVLSYFHSYCDLSARVVPEDSQNTRRLINYVLQTFGNWARDALNETPHGLQARNVQVHHWPTPDLLSHLALAQHYGIPTRLLDWSQSPFIAAYFAADGAIRHSTDSLSVWAILTTPLFIGVTLRDTANNSDVQLQIVTAPRAANPNLHAQQGLFTLITPSNDFPFTATDRRPVDEIFTGIDNPNEKYSPLLIEITCPSSDAPEVLWALDKLGVNASTVFADYSGAAKAVREFPLQRASNAYGG